MVDMPLKRKKEINKQCIKMVSLEICFAFSVRGIRIIFKQIYLINRYYSHIHPLWIRIEQGFALRICYITCAYLPNPSDTNKKWHKVNIKEKSSSSSSLVHSIPNYNVFVIARDMNAHIGKNGHHKFSLLISSNRNGQHLTDFMIENRLTWLNTRISLTLSRHFFLSFIASGRSSQILTNAHLEAAWRNYIP